jgi:hypothetical protein
MLEHVVVPDPIFGHPRLAAIYDFIDDDRSDLDAHVAIVEKLGAQSVLDIGSSRRATRPGGHGRAGQGVRPIVVSRSRTLGSWTPGSSSSRSSFRTCRSVTRSASGWMALSSRPTRPFDSARETRLPRPSMMQGSVFGRAAVLGLRLRARTEQGLPALGVARRDVEVGRFELAIAANHQSPVAIDAEFVDQPRTGREGHGDLEDENGQGGFRWPVDAVADVRPGPVLDDVHTSWA